MHVNIDYKKTNIKCNKVILHWKVKKQFIWIKKYVRLNVYKLVLYLLYLLKK